MKKENTEPKQDKAKLLEMEKTVAPKRKQKVTRSVIVEANGNKINVEDLDQKAEDEFLKRYPDTKIHDLIIYINTNEGTAYYVINGMADETFKILI